MNQRPFHLTTLALLLGGGAVLRAAPPQITRVEPFAVAPGKTIDFTLHGKHLASPSRLWASFNARCEFAAAEDEASKKGEKLICHLTVPRGGQVGIGVIRAVTSEGVSNPILVMVDDLRSVVATSDNHTVETAQLLDLPVAVDSHCDPVKECFFRFYAKAGQRISFEIVAQRLGSKLDPVLRLLTADGRQVFRLDDARGVGGDSRFSHTFETEGDYLLAIRDVRHLGGSEYRYRLRIGSFPLITAVYPAGGRSGAVTSFHLTGEVDDLPAPLHVALPVGDSPRLVSFSIAQERAGDETGGSGWFQVKSNPGAEFLEQEPNDDPKDATAVSVPSVLNGRLEKPADRDHFRFHATKGQRLHCVAVTRQLGSPCDLYMSLHRTDGTRIAEARQERDTVLDYEIGEDGEYVLQVEDLISGGSAEHVYRVEIQDEFFGFSIHTEQMQYSAPCRGTVVVKVLAKRRGYNGPIELAALGLGEGVKLEGNKLEGAETLLKITMPSELAQGDCRLAKIVGTAKVGDQTFTVDANQREPLVAMFPNALSLPTALEETIAFGVGPPFPPFFDLAVADDQLYLPQLIGTSTFDIEIKRTNGGFKDAIRFDVDGLPEGVTAEIAPVEDGLKAFRVTLKGPPDREEGSFPIKVVGTGKFQEQTRKVTLDNLTLRITKPLVVSLAMAGPISAGGRQEAEVRLQRFGAKEPQPVRIHVSGGPAGILAPIFITIPGDTGQAKLQLSAAADATPGKFDNLTVVASTTVQGQNITVESDPATIEVVPSAGESKHE